MIKFIKKLSLLIWNNSLYQYIFFTFTTTITVILMGYYFGSFDQAIHIPFLKKYADPTLYPNDPFFELSKYHYSFFWFMFLPFYRIGILEITMFFIHIAITFFTFWSIYRLSKTLFNNPLTSFLSTIAFVFPHIGFAGFPVFEFSLLNRTFVLPFLLLAIDYYLKRKYVFAYLILGLMYNLHIISVNFVLAMFLFDSIARIRKIDLRKSLTGIVFFIILALPVLIWKFSNSPVDIKLDWYWFKLINLGLFYHLFTLVSLNPLIIFLVGSGLSLFLIYIICRKTSTSHYNNIVDNFMIAALIVIIIQILVSIFFPMTIVIQSQIIRIGIFVTIFTYFYLGNFASQYLNKDLKKLNNNILLSSLFLSTTPIIALIGLLSIRFNKSIKKYALTIIISAFFIFAVLAYMMNIWKPGINIYPVKDELYKAEIWAKENTPKETVFIIPPYLWWFYNTEWRVIAERSVVATFSDLLEIAFLPSYLKGWLPRFEAVAPNVINRLNGNIFENVKIVYGSYNSLTESHILEISKKYQADYFVAEKSKKYNFPIVYTNKKYVIFKLNLFN